MRTGTTRPEIRPDGSSMKMPAAFARRRLARMAANSKAIFPLDLMQMLLEPGIRNFVGLPFSRLARLPIRGPIA